jgi:hypothetical protein
MGRGVLGASATPKVHNHKRCPDVDVRQLAHRCIPKYHRREFLARMLVGGSANTWIVLAPTSRRSAKQNARQSNQYAPGSELVESFFHLGFKAACKHDDAATLALPQPDVNRWLRYVGRTFFNFPRHRTSLGVDSKSKHKTIGKFCEFYTLQERPCRFSGICRILGKNGRQHMPGQECCLAFPKKAFAHPTA